MLQGGTWTSWLIRCHPTLAPPGLAIVQVKMGILHLHQSCGRLETGRGSRALLFLLYPANETPHCSVAYFGASAHHGGYALAQAVAGGDQELQ